jgi:hypothetical protein
MRGHSQESFESNIVKFDTQPLRLPHFLQNSASTPAQRPLIVCPHRLTPRHERHRSTGRVFLRSLRGRNRVVAAVPAGGHPRGVHLADDAGGRSRTPAGPGDQHSHPIGRAGRVGQGVGRRPRARDRVRWVVALSRRHEHHGATRLPAAVLRAGRRRTGDPAGDGAVAEVAGPDSAVRGVPPGWLDGTRMRRQEPPRGRRRQHRQRSGENRRGARHASARRGYRAATRLRFVRVAPGGHSLGAR